MKLYLVTDEELLLGKDLYRTVEAAVRGGVSIVQLREKESSTRDFIERAIRLKEVLAPYRVPLIINDRVDVALAADADGVHVGQSDMPYEMVKRLLPEGTGGRPHNSKHLARPADLYRGNAYMSVHIADSDRSPGGKSRFFYHD